MKNIDYTSLIEDLKTSDDKQRAKIIDTLSRDYNNAMPLLWLEALEQENPRSILSVIRDIIKKEKPRGIFKRTMGNSKQKLGDFLKHSDPKVRKNVCGIIGEIGDPEYLEALYSAYDSEDQLFVKSSYVLAIGNCGGVLDAEKLTKILEEKSKSMQEDKHSKEERLALTKAIAKLSPPVHHEFIGFKNPVPMVLTAMNGQFQVTLTDLEEKSIKGKLITEGILIKEKDLKKVNSCRTFYELLYPIDSCSNLKMDYKAIASSIIKADVVGFLNQCHAGEGNTPFWYRIEFKTNDYNKERTEFVKNLSGELDQISGGKLRNSPSSYEIEIRIIENKGLYSVFIKLYTVKDNRFDYREKSVPASINPVTAAIVMKAIEKWLKPNAKVIDPFCGAGTMLIERAKLKEFKTLTGVDIYGSAITAATTNSSLANIKMELIPEDILEYSTYNVFDEMISNMPFESKGGSGDFNTRLYRDFVDRIPSLIRRGGMVFLYTVESNLLKKSLVGNEDLQVIDTIKVESGGLIPQVFIIKVK